MVEATEKITAQITLEYYKTDSFGHAMSLLLDEKLTFDEALQGPPLMSTHLPHPGVELHFLAPEWMKSGSTKPRLRDTQEWSNLVKFALGTGKNLLMVTAGATAGIYASNLIN